MKTILQTKRTYLRELTQEDFANLCTILQDAETMTAYEHAFSDEEVQAWLDNQQRRYREDGFGLWAVIHRETGGFLGQMGLTIQTVEGTQELEIGYLLCRKHWHQGYAAEVAQALKNYAFTVLDADRVVSIVRDTNTASQMVAKRNGMTVEKTFVKHYYGVTMPHYLFAVKRE